MLNVLIVIKQSFKVNGERPLNKYNNIWERVNLYGNLLSIKFDSEPVYSDNDKYRKTKIKLYGDKVNTNL